MILKATDVRDWLDKQSNRRYNQILARVQREHANLRLTEKKGGDVT
jgi:hypothetical protein